MDLQNNEERRQYRHTRIQKGAHMFALYLMFISCSEKDGQEPVELLEEDQEETQVVEEEIPEEESEGSDAFCTPQPNIQTQALGFDVFQKMREVEEQSCFLSVRDIDTDNDGYSDSSEEFNSPSAISECEDENNCVQTLPSFAVSWTESSAFNLDLYTHGALSEGIVDGERIIVDGTETIVLHIAYHAYGSTADQEIERIYSPEGSILEERFYFNGDLWFEVFNTWEDELLVSQDAYDHINANGTHTNLQWSYDEEGRMIQSVYATDNQPVSTASFAYDEEGRLLQLTRDVDGEVQLKQSWTYENGVLLSRSSEYIPYAQWYTSADDAHAQGVLDYSSHWDSSIPTAGENCVRLPYSVMHGYPDQEKVYQLGWERNDVPNNIGFSYQYDGYGWNYGTLSWFGHTGVASIFDTTEWNADTMRKNTITYQDGTMVTEVLTNVNDEESSFSITRTRTFEGDLMITDEVIETNTSSPVTKTLSFSYDEQGNLQTRNLHLDGVHTHHNTWSYDAQGHLTGHNISMLLSDSDTLSLIASYRQTITEDEDSYVRIREKKSGDETWEVVDQLMRGESSNGRYEIRNQNYVVFNDENQIVMQGYGEIDNPMYYSSASENQYGLLESWTQAAYEDITNHQYQYTCE